MLGGLGGDGPIDIIPPPQLQHCCSGEFCNQVNSAHRVAFPLSKKVQFFGTLKSAHRLGSREYFNQPYHCPGSGKTYAVLGCTGTKSQHWLPGNAGGGTDIATPRCHSRLGCPPLLALNAAQRAGVR